MFSYDSSSQAINDLINRGYDKDLNPHVEGDKIIVDSPEPGNKLSLSPADFVIDEVYRFEGNSDPGDEMVVYAVSSEKYKLKGFLVDAFGPYSNSNVSEVIKKLTPHPGREKPEEMLPQVGDVVV